VCGGATPAKEPSRWMGLKEYKGQFAGILW